MRNINKQELREKFEAWAERAGALPWGYLKKQRTDSGNYSDQIYTYMWLAWNSSYFELLDERDTQNKLAELRPVALRWWRRMSWLVKQFRHSAMLLATTLRLSVRRLGEMAFWLFWRP